MAKLKESFTCIDIGSSSIKLLIGEWAPEKVSLKKVIVLPFKKEFIPGLDDNAKFEILSKIVSKEKIKGKVIISYATFGRIAHAISVAPMPNDEIREAVKWEIIQKKQLDPLSIIFDFIVSDKTYDESAEKKEIYLTYNKKKEISQLEKIFSSRKISLQAIENPNFSLIHALVKLKTISTDDPYLILDFGASCLRFIIVHKKQIIFERDLDFGGGFLTKDISDACKIKIEEAESDKIEYGVFSSPVVDDKIIEVQKVLQSSLDNMVSKILYSIKYFSYQVTKSKITSYKKVLLTGEGANLKGLKELIEKNIPYDCSLVDFSDSVKLPGNFEKDNSNPWPLLNAALGLGFWDKSELNQFCTSVATSSMSSRNNSSNLGGLLKSKYSTIFMFIILTIGLCALGVFNLNRINYSIGKIKNRNVIAEKVLRNKESQMEKDKLKLEALGEEVNFLESKKNDAINKISAFNIYQNQAQYASEIFEIVSSIRPSDLYMTSIDIGEFVIKITGVSKSHKMISSFMKTLNDSKLLKNCKFIFAKKKSNTVFIEFEINAEKIL